MQTTTVESTNFLKKPMTKTTGSRNTEFTKISRDKKLPHGSLQNEQQQETPTGSTNEHLQLPAAVKHKDYHSKPHVSQKLNQRYKSQKIHSRNVDVRGNSFRTADFVRNGSTGQYIPNGKKNYRGERPQATEPTPPCINAFSPPSSSPSGLVRFALSPVEACLLAPLLLVMCLFAGLEVRPGWMATEFWCFCCGSL